MRIRTRPTQTLIALLAAVGLLVVSAPGLAAAALGASEIRWELRNANTRDSLTSMAAPTAASLDAEGRSPDGRDH